MCRGFADYNEGFTRNQARRSSFRRGSNQGSSTAESAGGSTAPIRLRISCWRRRSRGLGCAGFSRRGFTMAAASSADSRRAELGGGGVKIRARRRFGAVDAVAPLDHIQIQLENARLLQLGLEPPRDDELAQLAQRVLRRRQIEVLGELLRDGAAAAKKASARPVGLERLLQLLEIHALVLPERIVFGDEHGALQTRARCGCRPTHRCTRRGFCPLARASLRAQLHERRRRRIRRSSAAARRAASGTRTRAARRPPAAAMATARPSRHVS